MASRAVYTEGPGTGTPLDEEGKAVGGGSNRKLSVTTPQLKYQGQPQHPLVLLADSASSG